MRHSLRTALILAFLAIFSIANAQAQTGKHGGHFFGSNAPGKWIIGAKIAKIDVNAEDEIDNNIDNIESADAVGIVLGYEFARPVGDKGGSSTVELEYLTGDTTSLADNATYDADLANLFFTYRSPGTLYFKAKLGLSYSNVDIRTPLFTGDSEDVSLAAGLGIGYHIGELGVVEVEYSTDSGDNDLSVLGVNAMLEF